MQAIVILPTYLMTQLPVILVWIVGVILALFYRKRYPKISLMALAAIVIVFVNSAAGAILNLYLALTLQARGWSANQTSLVSTAGVIVQSLIAAVAWGLVLAAIFGERNKP